MQTKLYKKEKVLEYTSTRRPLRAAFVQTFRKRAEALIVKTISQEKV